MLWQKSWWETRWVLLLCMTILLFFAVWLLSMGHAGLDHWVSSLRNLTTTGREANSLLPLLGSYRGYLWGMWFRNQLLITFPIFAIGMGGTFSYSSCPWMSGGAARPAAGLFTFSLPVSRRRVLLTHAAVVASELVMVAFLPSFMFPLVSHLSGLGSIPFGSTAVHALLFALGGMVFLAISYLLIALFNSQWLVMAFGFPVSFALFFPFRIAEGFPRWNLYHVMSGETYFLYGRIPWLELLVWSAIAAAFFLLAVRLLERRDF